MQDKLQELTDKLYKEGLSKGKEEGAAILADAKEKAEKLLADAQKEAEAIVGKARKDADEMKAKVDSDLKMAISQSIQATKQDVENVIVSKISDAEVKSALSSADFLKGIIKTVAEKFSAEESSDIALLLPESLKAELEPFVKKEIAAVAGAGVEADFSSKISGGFKIGPKDGSYFISLTDDTFQELIREYLRPTTRKILFGA